MSDLGFLGTIIGVLVTLAGSVFAALRYKSASYGDLQEDVDKLRARLDKVETGAARREAELIAQRDHYEAEVLDLRQGIEERRYPPLPPRKTMPPAAPPAAVAS